MNIESTLFRKHDFFFFFFFFWLILLVPTSKKQNERKKGKEKKNTSLVMDNGLYISPEMSIFNISESEYSISYNFLCSAGED